METCINPIFHESLIYPHGEEAMQTTQGKTMTIEKSIRAIAGTFILLSLALGYLSNPWWHLFTAFVGANLLQSAITGFCPIERLLTRLGVKRDAS